MKDDQPELHPRCKSEEEIEEVQPRLENQVVVVQLCLELGTHLVEVVQVKLVMMKAARMMKSAHT